MFTPCSRDYEEYLRPFPLTRESIDHWIDLLRTFMPSNGNRQQAPSAILDLGSGGGTSVFPLIGCFPTQRSSRATFRSTCYESCGNGTTSTTGRTAGSGCYS